MAKLSSPQTPKSALINVMSQAVYKAARGLVRDFGELEHLQITRKSVTDFVSAADKKSEEILVDELKKARPKFGFLCEERGIIKGADDKHRWIIDPLDGTTNFLHGMPYFAINVALEFDNEIIAAITYQPITDEMYWAEKGKGTYCNQRRLRVASRDGLDGLLLEIKDSQIITSTQSKNYTYRHLGATALSMAYVAAGRFDGCVIANPLSWDVAAGILLINEAGGKVVTSTGTLLDDSNKWLVAGNESVCKLLHVS